MADKPTKPTEIDTWADSGTVVEPTALKKSEGWADGEQPPHEYRNWLEKTEREGINTSRDYTEEVADYTDQKVDGVEGGYYLAKAPIEIDFNDPAYTSSDPGLTLIGNLGDKVLKLEGDLTSPNRAPIEITPADNHPSIRDPGDIWPFDEEIYHSGTFDEYRLLHAKRVEQLFRIPLCIGTPYVDLVSNTPAWYIPNYNLSSKMIAQPGRTATPSDPENERYRVNYPINGLIPDNVTLQEITFRVDPGVARPAGFNMKCYFYKNDTLIASAEDNNGSAEQSIVLSSLAELLDFTANSYWLCVQAGKTSGADELLYIDLEYDAQ